MVGGEEKWEDEKLVRGWNSGRIENIFVLGFGVHPQMYRNGFVRVEFMYVLYRMVGMSQVTCEALGFMYALSF